MTKRTPTQPRSPASKKMVPRELAETLAIGNRSLRSRDIEFEDCSLVVIEGPHKGLSLPLLKDMILIGRRADLCDMVLDQDIGISGVHARIQIEQDHKGSAIITLQDLNSRNGTRVGDLQIKEVYLTFGSTVKLSHTKIRLEANTKKNKKSLTINFFDQTGTLVGQSQSMRRIFSMLTRIGHRNVPVLITGETGTGKSTIANALHMQSDRKKRPFVSVNCGSLAPSLIESALFGHEQGAFTGADKQHQGYFEQAHGGTLFLDEIGELPLELQPKLLSVLERKRIMRLGGSQEVTTDFRLIAATHRDLPVEISNQKFREDLYYRLSVVQVEVPPLRERPEDLPLLVHRILNELFHNVQFQVTDAAMRKLQHYLWPGNVRQLRNILERTVIFLEGKRIDDEDIELPSLADGAKLYKHLAESQNHTVGNTLPHSSPEHDSFLGMPLKQQLIEFERGVIEKALHSTNWNVPRAAELLEIAQSWLYKRIKKYDLKRD